jgi:hypothetical protein
VQAGTYSSASKIHPLKEPGMTPWRALLCCALTLGSCVHSSGAARDEPTVRTKGGDSATVRIPILIAKGELTEAEALLLHAIAGGLISREAASRMQEAIHQRRQQSSQQPGPERSPPGEPWIAPEEDPSGERRNCRTQLPGHPVCQDLPGDYTYHSVQQALNAMKQRLGAKNLTLHNPDDAEAGPCPIIGKHYNVRRNGERVGSIACCPCCVDADPAPVEWTKCRIVW